MLKHIVRLTAGAAVLVLAMQGTASAASAVTGRITSYGPTSISVLDKEVVTLTIDSRTAFTKWVTQKPWEQDTRLTAAALRVGQLVAMYRRDDDSRVASWVQIATDVQSVTAAPVFADRPLTAVAAAPGRETSSDLLPPAEVVALIKNARTPADHTKLSKHYAAVAARYDADAAEHSAEAKAYRAKGNPSETKRPGTPGTAAHCERLAALASDAAVAARELSREHEAMASTVK